MTKSKEFERKIKERGIDIERIMKVNSNKTVTEFGRKYTAKEHHSKMRKTLINLQNKYWADMPMSILGILSLCMIPIFQYCEELK